MTNAHPTRHPSPAWAILAFLCYAVHAAYNLLDHHPENLLWSCHVATVLVGIGLLRGSATLNGIGFVWLIVGDLIWIIDLHNGAEFLPTSVCTHGGGLILSLVGVKALGMPRQVWWKAVLGLWMLQDFTRQTMPPDGNVNLAFGLWPGWEHVFRSYLIFEVFLMASMSAIFFLAETAARSLLASNFDRVSPVTAFPRSSRAAAVDRPES